MTMIYIFAGNHREAIDWAREQKMSKDDFRYISGPEKIRGVERGLKFVCIGTYGKRRDRYEIYHSLYLRNAVDVSKEYSINTITTYPRGM